jgi:hypothetical protein
LKQRSRFPLQILAQCFSLHPITECKSAQKKTRPFQGCVTDFAILLLPNDKIRAPQQGVNETVKLSFCVPMKQRSRFPLQILAQCFSHHPITECKRGAQKKTRLFRGCVADFAILH